MTATIILTAAQAQAFNATPVGETFWLVRANYADVSDMSGQAMNDGGYACSTFYAPDPPAEFVQACAPCDRCEEGCDITVCLDCGEDYSEPCARHLTAGHHASTDPYGDSVDCHACCPDCRIELVGPCPNAEGCPAGMAPLSCGRCYQIVQVGGTVTLGHAYAVGQPLPIAWEDDFSLEWQVSHNPIVIVTERAPHLGPRLIAWHDPDAEPVGIDLTAAVAHYGPPETLVGQWAIALRRVA